MKNVVGPPARGEDFYYRSSEIQKILDRIDAGNNLQIAAPRRVGKTSILRYLTDNKPDNLIYVYVDVEGVNNERDFYKKLLKAIVNAPEIKNSRRIASTLEKGEKLLKKVKSIKLAGYGIDFVEDNAVPDFCEEVSNFLSSLEMEAGQKLVLLIDEFPQAIQNIVNAGNADYSEAIHLLESNRELRLSPEILGKVLFIYTGSIGLNHTVAAINASAFINDLNSTEVGPLSQPEGRDFIRCLLQPMEVSMDEATTGYLLQKIGWLIPFHIQLAIQHIRELCRQKKAATTADVDQAFEQMVTSHNNNYFEHYHSRLKSQLKDEAFHYAEAILQQTAMAGSTSNAEIYDQAVAHGVTNRYRQIIELLAYDGYINNGSADRAYQFNSPLLRLWWQKYASK